MRLDVRRPIRRDLPDSLLHWIGKTLGLFYRLAFDGFDEIAYRIGRKKLIAEIELSFSYLFLRRKGKVLQSEGRKLPRAFDYVSATLEFPEVVMQIVRGRGELSVYLSLPAAPYRWEDLDLLWSRPVMRDCGSPPSIHAELSDVAGKLDRHWDQLTVALES